MNSLANSIEKLNGKIQQKQDKLKLIEEKKQEKERQREEKNKQLENIRLEKQQRKQEKLKQVEKEAEEKQKLKQEKLKQAEKEAEEKKKQKSDSKQKALEEKQNKVQEKQRINQYKIDLIAKCSEVAQKFDVNKYPTYDFEVKIAFLIEALSCDDTLSKIYNSLSNLPIIVTDLKKQSGVMYDKERKLYVEFSPQMIYNNITSTMKKEIDCCIDLIHKNKSEYKGMSAQEMNNINLRTLEKCRANMKTVTRLDSVIKCLLPLKYDPDFSSKLDVMGNILPLKGGKIINLETKEIRKRTANDYFTYELDLEITDNKKELKKIKEILRQICGDNDAKLEYLSIVLGSMLTIDMSNKCFYIFYGEQGNNGKSVISNALFKMFPKMSVSIPQELLFTEDAAKVSDTTYGAILGKRAGIFSEPSGKRISESIMKKITGGDILDGRHLYAKKFNFKPTLKICISSNELIYMNVKSRALMNRLRVINFDSVFCKDPKQPNEYQIDPDLETKLETKYKNAFFSYLVKYAHKYLNGDKIALTQQPEELMFEKTDYMRKIDKLSSFIHDECKLSKNGFTERARFKEAFYKYLSDRNQFKPSEHDTLQELAQLFKLTKRNGYWGYIGVLLKNQDSDSDQCSDSDDEEEQKIEQKDNEVDLIKALKKQLEEQSKLIADLQKKSSKNKHDDSEDEKPKKKKSKASKSTVSESSEEDDDDVYIKIDSKGFLDKI
jgi:P4 family phage/plasmid primase-like protien